MNIQPTFNTQQYLQQILQQQNKLPGQNLDWLQSIRQSSIDNFRTQGFPTFHQEDWKYTNVEALAKRSFKLAENASLLAMPENKNLNADSLMESKPVFNINSELIKKRIATDFPCHELIFINGQYHHSLSQLLSLPKNIIISDLQTALKQYPQQIAALLTQIVASSQHGFTALNHALLRDGIFIHVPQNVVIENPIHCVFISCPSDDISWSQPHNLIQVDAGGELTILESYVNLGSEAEYFTNTITEINVGQNARVEHIKIQDENAHAFHIGTTFANVLRDGNFISHSLGVGGKLVRSDTHVKLAEVGANCELNGLYCVQEYQHMDHHTTIEHLKPHGTSREFYRGIATDHARAIFNGKVIVYKDAQKTDAQQENNNLLLSNNAEINAKPQLEIYADDVKCTHGATIGQLDDEALFYLRARGIELATAKNVLKYAFAATVVEKIKSENIRKYLQSLVLQRFPIGNWK